MPDCPHPPSPLCSLFHFQGQQLYPSACPADRQQPVTRGWNANSQRQLLGPGHSLAQTSTDPLGVRLSRLPSSSDLPTVPASASGGLLSDFPDSPTLLSGPLLLQVQFLIPAGSVAAIWKNESKIHIDLQKMCNSQNSFEKEQNWRTYTSWFQHLL